MKVLVVAHDPAVRELVAASLRRRRYAVVTARDSEEALAHARAHRPSLVLLDVALPGMDGWELCRILRAESDVPIMMLAPPADQADLSAGREAGADDYLTRPFSPRQLITRVEATLRRGGRSRRRQGVLRAGPLVVDRARRVARAGDQELTLRPKEFDLLVAFMEHAGRVLSREQILARVWGFEEPGKTRTVDVHVNHLRRRLAGSGVRIETLRGVGYRFVAGER